LSSTHHPPVEKAKGVMKATPPEVGVREGGVLLALLPLVLPVTVPVYTVGGRCTQRKGVKVEAGAVSCTVSVRVY
jgi:hypothetical protein